MNRGDTVYVDFDMAIGGKPDKSRAIPCTYLGEFEDTVEVIRPDGHKDFPRKARLMPTIPVSQETTDEETPADEGEQADDESATEAESTPEVVADANAVSDDGTAKAKKPAKSRAKSRAHANG